MPLTELQLPDKARFYRDVQAVAGEIDSRLSRWEGFADFIGKLDTSDLDAMGVGTGQVRTDLTNFRTALNEVVAFMRGESTTQTIVMKTAVDEVRRPLTH